MNRETPTTAIYEATRSVDPAQVAEYAWLAGWHKDPRLGRGQVAVYQRSGGKDQISIPLSRKLQDFELLMGRAISILAESEGRSPAELLAELSFPGADVLRFTERSHASANGDIPFERGMQLLNGAKKALLAAACSAIRPATFYSRMNFSEAEQFIEQCRLGQTERGSFVLTVACPLNAVKFDPDLFDKQPFTRRVTNTLMRSLALIAYPPTKGRPDSAIRQNDEGDGAVLSANLCDGLLEMAPEGDDASLLVTAEFSKKHPSDEFTPVELLFPSTAIPAIEQLAGKLRPVHVPKRQVFVGLVETLNGRPTADGRPQGQVVLRTITPDQDVLHPRVELEVDDYSVAAKAHLGNLPVSLNGILRQTGRKSFRIDEISAFAIVGQGEAG